MNENDALDAMIGQRVRENQERRRVRNQEKYPEWLAEGQLFRRQREVMGISKKKLSKHMSVDVSVVDRFEKGLYIKRRSMFKSSYVSHLDNIAKNYREGVENLKKDTTLKD